MKRFALAALALLVAGPLEAATRYVSPEGVDSGDALTMATSRLTPDYGVRRGAAAANGDSIIFINDEDGSLGTAVWDGTGGADPPSGGTFAYSGNSAADKFYLTGQAGSTIIFDGSGVGAPPNRAFFMQNDQWIVVENLWFRDYYDDDETSSGTPTGTLFISNQTALGTRGGLTVRNCRFYASAPGAGTYIDGGVVMFGSAAGWDTDSLVVVGCSFEDMSNAAISNTTAGIALYSKITGNYIHRDVALWRCDDPDGPNAINLFGYETKEVLIEGNHLVGWDHGMEVRGEPAAGREWWEVDPGCVIRGNFMHDFTDDFIWIHGEDGSGEPWSTRHWLIENNLCYYGGDEGFETQGDRHLIQHNTIVRNGNWLIAFSNPGSLGGLHPSKRHVVRNNLFIDAAGDQPLSAPHCDGDGDDGVFVNQDNGVTLDLELYGNIFFDQGGALEVNDQNDGAVTTIAGLNGTWASGTGIGNTEVDPMLVDTSAVVDAGGTPPFFPFVNLHPRSNSPAVNAGTSTGKTKGALPCGECFHWQLSAQGFVPDSLHLETFDQRRKQTGFYYHDGLWHDGAGHFHDEDLDSTMVGHATARWSVFRNADPLDSLVVLQRSDPIVSLSARAVATETQLADDFAALPTAAEIETELIDGGNTQPWSAFGGTVDSVRAVGTAWLADSVRVDLSIGAHTGTIEFEDAATSTRINNVHYIVRTTFSDTGPIAQKKIVGFTGSDPFQYNIGESFWFWAWVPGSYSLKTGNFKPVAIGHVQTVQLDKLPTAPPSTSAEVSMTFFVGDFGGGLTDSMEVSVKPLGRRPRAGATWIPESWIVQGLTDSNGRVEFSIFRSSEITAAGSSTSRTKWTLRAVDKRSPKIWPDIVVPSFTAPDSTNADVVHNVD